MNPTLTELFMSSKGQPITWHGKTIVLSYKRIVSANSQILIERVRSSTNTVQALRINASKKVLRIDDIQANKLILWADTSPSESTLNIGGRGQTELCFYNAWRRQKDGYNITDSGLMNSGIHVTEQGNSVLLECSDGVGEVDFSDLVVRLTFTEPY
jgi:hypothetical protein